MEQINEAIVKTVEPQAPQKKRKKGWIALLVLAVFLAGAYIGLCAYADSLNTFYPNSRVLGVEVGGLTVSAAQEAIEQEIPARQIELFEAETDTLLYSVTLGELGYQPDVFAGMAESRMRRLAGEYFLVKGASFLSYLITGDTSGDTWPGPEQPIYEAKLDEIAQTLSYEPQDASFALTDGAVKVTVAKDGRRTTLLAVSEAVAEAGRSKKTSARGEIAFEVLPAKVLTAQEIHNELAGEMKNAAYDKETAGITAEQIGVSFDVAAVQKKLDATQPGETVDIAAQVEYPTVTAEELEKVLFRDVLGECRTHVSGTAARINNVKLSAATINGYVMNSGEVFSYNEAVGQRTAANGYQPAPAYIQGETVDEIGGGICQTSSTLYLACLRGDLEITERYAHRYVPAYILWGADATVSWGGPDYKFTNNTDYPIKIVTEYEKNYLTVKILGTNVDGRYAEVTNEVLSTTPWTTVYEEDPTMTPGMPEKEKTSPYTGYKVKTYHTIYDADGKVIDSHYEATSDYKVRNKVILRAPAAVPVPEIPAAGTAEIPVVTPETPVEPEVPAEPAAPELLPGTEPVTPEGAL